jgi:hypothetical protein
MEDIRYQKQPLEYRPIGRRGPGRPLNRLLDGYNREAVTGHLLIFVTRIRFNTRAVWFLIYVTSTLYVFQGICNVTGYSQLLSWSVWEILEYSTGQLLGGLYVI